MPQFMAYRELIGPISQQESGFADHRAVVEFQRDMLRRKDGPAFVR